MTLYFMQFTVNYKNAILYWNLICPFFFHLFFFFFDYTQLPSSISGRGGNFFYFFLKQWIIEILVLYIVNYCIFDLKSFSGIDFFNPVRILEYFTIIINFFFPLIVGMHIRWQIFQFSLFTLNSYPYCSVTLCYSSISFFIFSFLSFKE